MAGVFALLFVAALVALLVWLLIRMFRGDPPPKNASDLLCTTCGTVGNVKTVTPGSLGTEIVLWICLILPGVFYTAWRFVNKGPACATCGAKTLVPVNSPVGQQLIAKQQTGGSAPLSPPNAPPHT